MQDCVCFVPPFAESMSLKRGIIPRAPHTEHKAAHTWPKAAQTWPKAVHICAKVVHIFFGFVLAFFWGDCVEVVFLFPRSARGSSAGFCGVLVGGCFDEPAASAFTSARAATSPRHLTILRIAVSSSLNTSVLFHAAHRFNNGDNDVDGETTTTKRCFSYSFVLPEAVRRCPRVRREHPAPIARPNWRNAGLADA